jgi:hypothetical protein
MSDEFLALLRQSMGDFEHRRSTVEAGIASGNRDAGMLRHAAWLAAAAGDFEAAQRHLLAASNLAEDAGNAHFASGLLWLSKNDGNSAFAQFS